LTDQNQSITLYGTTWCFDTRRARAIFEEMNIPYIWVDIDMDHQAREYVQRVNQGNRSVPTIVFPDGSILVEPENDALREKLSELSHS
jgi:mycoredoxin